MGAGLAQVDAIRRAKQLGYRVLATDGSAEAPGLKVADEGRNIDVKDVEQNLNWARSAKIDGVTSYASDIVLPTVLAIREALGLPGLSRRPLEISLDKSKQRILFSQHGLQQPDFSIVTNIAELRNSASRLGLPLVVKPIDNAGSRGVIQVTDEPELDKAFERSVSNSKKGVVIAEQFIEGLELTVEGISIGGKHHILAISDKYKPDSPYRVATQLVYPAAISADVRMKVVDLITKAYEAMGVDNTPTHSEVIVSEEGPKIVEVSCRGGGFYVFTKVVEIASGYDIVGNWTRLCVGDSIEPVMIAQRGVVLRFFTAKPGKLVGVEGFDDAMSSSGVIGGLFINPGETVPELKTDGSRVGWIIARGKSRKEAVDLAHRVFAKVKFHVEEV